MRRESQVGKTILYGKFGRSMPLTLDKCGNLGGDVEMVAVVKTLALRHPDDHFILAGRNSGEQPWQVGLPDNVTNPWTYWADELRTAMKVNGIGKGLTSVEAHFVLQRIYDQMTLPMFVKADAQVWWVGQHGTSNMPLPRIKDRSDDPTTFTKPQDSFAYYASWIFRGINAWRDVDPWNREEILLNADARNRHKMRDMKWPLRHPILTQYNFTNNLKHERAGDATGYFQWNDAGLARLETPGEIDKIWLGKVNNAYARLEVNGLLPGTPFGDLISYNDTWEGRGHFGLFINEARAIGVKEAMMRRTVMKDWVVPLNPTWVHGTWSEESQASLGLSINPAPWSDYYPKLHSVRSTFTTPSSGSGWATAKPWEAFAGGTVCFFHPSYDDQDNILGDAPKWLRDYLRVKNPAQLAHHVEEMDIDRDGWETVVQAQRKHFDEAITELRYVKMIEDRIYGEGK